MKTSRATARPIRVKVIQLEQNELPERISSADRRRIWSTLVVPTTVMFPDQPGSGMTRRDGWKYAPLTRPNFDLVTDEIARRIVEHANKWHIPTDIALESYPDPLLGEHARKLTPAKYAEIGRRWLKDTDLLYVIGLHHGSVIPIAAAEPQLVRHIIDQHPDCSLTDGFTSDNHVSRAVQVFGVKPGRIHFHGLAKPVQQALTTARGRTHLKNTGFVGKSHASFSDIEHADWIDVDVDGLAEDDVKTAFVPGLVRTKSLLHAVRLHAPRVVTLTEYHPENDYGNNELPVSLALHAFKAAYRRIRNDIQTK